MQGSGELELAFSFDKGGRTGSAIRQPFEGVIADLQRRWRSRSAAARRAAAARRWGP